MPQDDKRTPAKQQRASGEIVRAAVTGPDGKTYHFPAHMTEVEVSEAMRRIYAARK